MNLVKDLLNKITDPALSHNERALIRCRLAKEMEEIGNYEGAREAMGELWQHIGERPQLEGLDEATAAEVLLQVGVLTGCIGKAKEVEGAQEIAKDLITESISIFEQLQQPQKVIEAQTNLAVCYLRQGAFDEARIVLRKALSKLEGGYSEIKALALLRSASVEKLANRLNDALRILAEAAPIFEVSNNHALKGRFHNEYAQILRRLSDVEHRQDYIDRAFIEYAAASFHFQQAGHSRYQAYVENNTAFLFFTLGKYPEAHEHLDRAQALFTSLKDSVHIAQVDETRARVFLAEGRVADAERLARGAVQVLEKGGEQSLFAEALTTHGTALARLGRRQQAQLTLQQAVEVAQQAGDVEGAGQAGLAMIEELGEQLNETDLSATYERAAELLEQTQHPGVLARLNKSALKVLHLLAARPVPTNWEGFSLKDEVRRYERRFIVRALEQSKGSVTRAAQLLGLKHQTLIALLNSRHRDLLHARKPISPRRRSIIRANAYTSKRNAEKERPVSILHVEDSKLVSDAVRDTLRMEGWSLQLCTDGSEALKILQSDAVFDLLLFDNELPGVSGLELVREARRLRHRRRTPIVMLSAVNCEREAMRAGVDEFLRKPEDVLMLARTISRLLGDKAKPRG